MRTSTASFRAPWGPAVTWLTIAASALLAGIALLEALVIPRQLLGGWPWLLAVGLPLAILAGSALFTVRGYELAPRLLRIRRLLWSTEVPLDELARAWAAPDAMAGSIRLFGNGGLFAISGLMRSSRLGRYRAFVTDPARAVVLELGDRKVMISPDDPQRLLRELSIFAPDVVVEEPA